MGMCQLKDPWTGVGAAVHMEGATREKPKCAFPIKCANSGSLVSPALAGLWALRHRGALGNSELVNELKMPAGEGRELQGWHRSPGDTSQDGTLGWGSFPTEGRQSFPQALRGWGRGH